MTLNGAKCCSTTISEGRLPFVPERPLTIAESELTGAQNGLPYLGVVFDKKLNWSVNTRIAITKAKRAIGSIRRTFCKILTEKQRKTLIFGKIVPLFTYALVAAYPTLKGDQKLIERLHRYVCRVVSNDYTSTYDHLLQRLNVLPLYQSMTHRRILLAHRYFHGQRYQPPGTIHGLPQNPRLRLRSHADSIKVFPPTARDFTNSALEEIAEIWNRIPSRLATKKFDGLKKALATVKYHDASEWYRYMQDAIRLL